MADRRITPSRLRVARARRGFIKKKLADVCGVASQTISNWENGVSSPSDADIERLASILDFPSEFFFRPDLEPLPVGSVTFRGRSRIAADQRRIALAAGLLACELGAWIEQRFDLPEVSIPDLTELPKDAPDESAVLAAEIVRKEWALGDKPIPDAIRVLESKGILVFSLPQDCQDLDAFSFRLGPRPIVLLDTTKSQERTTMDAAHELGHLVLHRYETGRREEDQADSFAGAFLMPKTDILAHPPETQNLADLIEKKHRWRVSLAALIYRLRELRIITEWHYRTIFLEISRLRYRTVEPNALPRAPSRLLTQVFDYLKNENIGVRQVAADLAWNPKLLSDLIFGLGARLTGLEGGGNRTNVEPPALRTV